MVAQILLELNMKWMVVASAEVIFPILLVKEQVQE